MQPAGRVAAVRQLMLEHGGVAAAAASHVTVLCPMVKPELAHEASILEDRGAVAGPRQLARHAGAREVEGRQGGPDLDVGRLRPQFMTYPDQAFNSSSQPFFPVEVMDLAKEVQDTCDEALLEPRSYHHNLYYLFY